MGLISMKKPGTAEVYNLKSARKKKEPVLAGQTLKEQEDSF